MDVFQFDEFVLVPALNLIGLYSLEARSLMLGTALQESNLEYIKQQGGGPGLGIYQIEENTYIDIGRYLKRFDNIKLKERCLSACFYECMPSSDALVHNLRWATIMARIKYEMLAAAIPAYDDAKALATYYKRWYNSAGGKAEIDKVIPVFEHAIRIIKT